MGRIAWSAGIQARADGGGGVEGAGNEEEDGGVTGGSKVVVEGVEATVGNESKAEAQGRLEQVGVVEAGSAESSRSRPGTASASCNEIGRGTSREGGRG